MDIVDNNINTTKYVNNIIKRHVSLSNNIVFWLKLDIKLINENTKSIINKHKKVLNQKDTNTLIKCIKHNIDIVPIMYHLNDDNINLLINTSFNYINIYMIKHIGNHIKINREFIAKQMLMFCRYGCVNAIKYLQKKFELTKQDFQMNNNHAGRWACRNGHVNVVKYLHKFIGLDKTNFQSLYDINYVCIWACQNGHINMIKYLHVMLGFTKVNFQAYDNYAYNMACRESYSTIIKYLLKEINIFS